MGKPDTHHPAGKTVLQHRTPVISERLSKSDGFIDSNQSIQLRWGDFFLWCFAPHGVSYFRQSPWYLQAPPSRPPRIPLPGHTRKIEFPNMMSTFKFSLFGSNLSFAGILFFDFIQEVLFLALYSASACLFFFCPQLNNCPMDAGTEEWFQLHVELDRRRAVT